MSPDMSLVTDTLGYDIYWYYRGLYLLIFVFLLLSLGAGLDRGIMDTFSFHPPPIITILSYPGVQSEAPLQLPEERRFCSLQLAHRPNFSLFHQGEDPRLVASIYPYYPMQITIIFWVAVATTLRVKFI